MLYTVTLKTPFVRVSREKIDKKKTPKIRQKTRGRYGRTATEKKWQKSTIFKVFSKKKRIFRKNRKIYDFQGLLSQKIENSFAKKNVFLEKISKYAILKVFSAKKIKILCPVFALY